MKRPVITMLKKGQKLNMFSDFYVSNDGQVKKVISVHGFTVHGENSAIFPEGFYFRIKWVEDKIIKKN